MDSSQSPLLDVVETDTSAAPKTLTAHDFTVLQPVLHPVPARNPPRNLFLPVF